MRFAFRCLLIAAASLLAVRSASAQLKAGPGDWPGWRGPNRDEISTEKGLLKSWPKEGPELVWTAKGLGAGYSTPSVAKGVIYLLGTEGKNTECLIALDAKDGTQLWSTPFGKHAGGYDGPRSTPTVDGDTIFVCSSNGFLISAKTKSGEINWTKDLKKDFKGRLGGWACTESPLVDGDRLIITPGAENGPIVALDKKDGSVIWNADFEEFGQKNKNYSQAQYSSVVPATIQGVKQYVQFLRGGVVGVDAKTGKLLWHYDKPANGTANIPTPVIFGDSVYAASGYGAGGGLVNIVKKDDKLEAEEAFFLKEMQNHHGGMVNVGGYLYCAADNGNLFCVDLREQKVAWKTNKCIGKGSLTFADGHLYVRNERGKVALVEANPKEFKEVGRFDQPERSNKDAWPHPVVAGGRLYLRDQDVLLCFNVKE